MKKVIRWIVLVWAISTIPYLLIYAYDFAETFFSLLYAGLIIGLMVSDLKEGKK